MPTPVFVHEDGLSYAESMTGQSPSLLHPSKLVQRGRFSKGIFHPTWMQFGVL